MFANIRIPDQTAALFELLQAVYCMFQQTEPTGGRVVVVVVENMSTI